MRLGARARLWAVLVIGVGGGILGVIHLGAYVLEHPGPSVPPLELCGFLAFGFLPELLRLRTYRIEADRSTVSVADQDGKRSCARQQVIALAVTSEFDLSPKPGDPWRLRVLGTGGARLLQVRAAQQFGEGAIRNLAAYLQVPLEVQPPLFK
jgi:hypothetical protein